LRRFARDDAAATLRADYRAISVIKEARSRLIFRRGKFTENLNFCAMLDPNREFSDLIPSNLSLSLSFSLFSFLIKEEMTFEMTRAVVNIDSRSSRLRIAPFPPPDERGQRECARRAEFENSAGNERVEFSNAPIPERGVLVRARARATPPSITSVRRDSISCAARTV